MQPVLVSACLLGLATRYDGRDCQRSDLAERLRREGLLPIPVCPEQLGGLPTPRLPSEIQDGTGEDVLQGKRSVLDAAGRDVSDAFRRGAELTAAIASVVGARRAFLKSKSPSCGVGSLKRGDQTVPGCGVTAALLLRSGLEIQEIE